MSRLKHLVASSVVLAAGLVAIVLIVFGVVAFARGEGGQGSFFAILIGLLGMPGLVRLHRSTTAPAAPAPGWWAWLTSFALIGLPVYYAYGFSNFYGNTMPYRSMTGDMRSALYALAEAQREHHLAFGTYVADLAALDTMEAMKLSPENPALTLSITRADSTGWAARVEHRQVTTVCTSAGSESDPAPMPECSEGKLRR